MTDVFSWPKKRKLRQWTSAHNVAELALLDKLGFKGSTP